MDNLRVTGWSDGNGSFGFRIPNDHVEWLKKLKNEKMIMILMKSKEEIDTIFHPNLNKDFKIGNQEIIGKEIKQYFKSLDLVKDDTRQWPNGKTPEFIFEISENTNIIIVRKD